MIKMQALAGPTNEARFYWGNAARDLYVSSITGPILSEPAAALDMQMTLHVKDLAAGTEVDHQITSTELPALAIGIGKQQEWALTDLLTDLGYSPNTTTYSCGLEIDLGEKEAWLYGTVEIDLGADGTAVRLIG